MVKERRRWRYEVIDSWGKVGQKAPVGMVIVDIWKGNRTWNFINLATGEDIGGWRGKLLGEYKEDDSQKGGDNQ